MHRKRLAGVVLPLFSMRTRRDWGIGQISDLPAAAAWVRSAGHTLLQVLPAHELAEGETSPYGARSAFGLDPIYLDLEAVPDLDPTFIDEVLGAEGRALRARLRDADTVDYAAVRPLKARVLAAAFQRFYEREWLAETPRARDFRRFLEREREWLDDLGLYVVLREERGGFGWATWPEGERTRHPAALAEMRETHERRLLAYGYGQWLALGQWDEARAAMNALGVELMGDVPFIVGAESADVWARPTQFRRDVSLGAPPDGFSAFGQDWGLPAFDWDVMDATDLAWIRARARHAARLYDRFRLDHVIGYFRQYVRHPGQLGWFVPGEEPAQERRGERLLSAILHAAGDTWVVGEDLGVIPPFARATLGRLALPGYRVMPWERDEHHRLRHPHEFPELSVATWSTHDTAPISQWWGEMQGYERDDFAQLLGIPADLDDTERTLRLLRALYGATSDLALVLAQELLVEKRRINTPGTVGAHNWTYRLPATLQELSEDPEVKARFERVRAMVVESGRYT